jgi:lipopolysaccharide export system protein LptC
MLSTRTLFTYVALGLAAASSWWLAEALIEREAGEAKLSAGKVDYYSTDIHRKVLNLEGKPKELLFAETMTHYQDDDRTDMNRPVMTLYKENKPPWVIRADTGTALTGGITIFMNGNVRITRVNDAGETVEIITRNVRYVPDTQYADTTEHVTILSPNDQLDGNGMKVHFEPELNANILANVRRKHEMR